MIYHELFGQHLRLGNFLFKYAWSIAMKEKFGVDTIYPDYYLWQYLKNKPIVLDLPDYWEDQMLRPRVWEWTIEEEEFVNSHVNKNSNLTVALNFFFQSDKWFRGYEQEVKNSLVPHNSVYLDIFSKYRTIFNGKPSIGLGIRLGDFKGHGTFFQIPHDWYIKVLNVHFPDWVTKYNVVVFSDDIPEAKRLFKEYPFEYAEDNNTATHADKFKHYHGDASEQFFLGTMMDNFICGNSTFTWWQAYLCEGKVIHSGEVFSPTGNHAHCDITHYYPEHWIKEPI